LSHSSFAVAAIVVVGRSLVVVGRPAAARSSVACLVASIQGVTTVLSNLNSQ
jgi:hypothetical protein